MLKDFCENCKKIVNLRRKEILAEEIIREKAYKYMKTVDYCTNCGNVVTSKDSIKENLERVDNVYRKEENIISIEEISRILIKFKNNKKYLSKLLGIEEEKINKYFDGDIPNKEDSEKLYKLLEEQQKVSDIELISEYIIMKCKEITPLALQKLLYYSQGFYKAFYGDFLFNADCKAWVHGPVYEEIYYRYKNYGANSIEQNANYDIEDILDENKKVVIDNVIKSFGIYNGKDLEKMTHYEMPWIESRAGINTDEKGKKVISKEDIAEYFEKIKEEYAMFEATDIKEYSKKHFEEINIENKKY